MPLPALKSRHRRAYLLGETAKIPLKVIGQDNKWSVVITGTKPEQPFTVITLETDDRQTMTNWESLAFEARLCRSPTAACERVSVTGIGERATAGLDLRNTAALHCLRSL